MKKKKKKKKKIEEKVLKPIYLADKFRNKGASERGEIL